MPFMTNGKRDYKREAAWEKEHRGGKRRTERAKRNAARRAMIKAGKVQRNDGSHVDHKKPLISGGSNSKSNLSAVSAKRNLRKEAMRKGRS
jgi:hypothetical protein